MKKITNKLLLASLVVTSIGISSCFQKFDADSYAPPLNIGGFTSSKEIAPANLVGYWAFNGNYLDSVTNTAGTPTGITFSGGVKGQAMQGALNGYMLATPSAAITGMNSFTITYWVNSPLNTNGIVGLVNLANTTGFWGNIDMFFENGSTQSAAKFRAHIQDGGSEAWVAKDGLPGIFDNWVNFALSYDAATSMFKFYVNGNMVHSQTNAGLGPLNFTNVGNLVFGAVHFQTNPSQTSGSGNQPWASYLTGLLDEVRIYNKALTDNEVNALVKLEGRGK
ncbi:MAG TPA: LamG domain-containing protein [Flavisolibacter sp.]